MNKQEKQETKTHRHRQQSAGYQREEGRGEVKGQGSQIYVDGRFNISWWAYNANTQNMCHKNVHLKPIYYVNQCDPNKFDF